MSLSRLFVLLAFALLLGCHEQVSVPGPEWPFQRSYLLAVYTDVDPARIWAVDVTEGGPVPGPDLALQGSGELVAIHFSCPLDALGLAGGEALLKTVPETEVPLPRALGVQSLRFDGNDVGSWETTNRVPVEVTEALRRLPVQTIPNDCMGRVVSFSTELIPGLPGRGNAVFTLLLQSDQMLVGTNAERYFLVERNASAAPISPGIDGPFVAAYQAPDSRLWLLADDGRIVTGPVQGPWTETSSVPVSQDFKNGKLVGPDRGDVPFELFAAAGDRTIAHYDGTDWTDLSILQSDESRNPELVWLGPGRALAASVDPEDHRVVWIEQGQTRSEPAIDDRDSVIGLWRFEDDRLMLGTRGGNVRQFDGTSWISLGTISRPRAFPIVPFMDSFLVGSQEGLLNTGRFRWFQATEVGLCPVEPDGLPFVLAAWQTKEDEWLLITASRFASDADFGTVFMRVTPAQGVACPGGTVPLG